MCIADSLTHTLQREITESVSPDILANLVDIMRRGDQLLLGGRINTVVARGKGGRAADSHVDLPRPGLPYDAYDLAAGCAANNRIIDQDDSLSVQQRAHRIELELYAEVPDRLPRLDELRILVVDDNADGRTLTSLVLTQAGARVTAVASAREALQALMTRDLRSET